MGERYIWTHAICHSTASPKHRLFTLGSVPSLHSHISRICHGSHLPAIMWKKYRKWAVCISSTVFLLQHSWALDKQTNSHAEGNQPNLHPREATGSPSMSLSRYCLTESETCEPHSPSRSLGDEAQPHRSPETSAQQGDSEPCSEQGHHVNSVRCASKKR